jgi:hypothetical protein
MSALSAIIESAVGGVIAEHPKLFDPKQRERAQKLLVREIMKSLTREPKGEVDDGAAPAPAPAETAPQIEIVARTDARAKAYCALCEIAGAPAPHAASGGSICIPSEGLTARAQAFAELPPEKSWPFVTERPQLAAWFEFFDDVLPHKRRREIMEVRAGKQGVSLPWPWPPSKIGKVYEAPPTLEVGESE